MTDNNIVKPNGESETVGDGVVVDFNAHRQAKLKETEKESIRQERLEALERVKNAGIFDVSSFDR